MARKSKNRQGFTVYHDVYDRQLQYMSDARIGQCLRICFEYSKALASGEINPDIDTSGFEGFERGALLSMLDGVDRGRESYFRSVVHKKLRDITQANSREKWKAICAKSDDDLYRMGFTFEQVDFIRHDEELTGYTITSDSTPVHPSTPQYTPVHTEAAEHSPAIQHEQEQEREHETEREQEHETERERIPMNRRSVMQYLINNGVEMSEANQLINKLGLEAAHEAITTGKTQRAV